MCLESNNLNSFDDAIFFTCRKKITSGEIKPVISPVTNPKKESRHQRCRVPLRQHHLSSKRASSLTSYRTWTKSVSSSLLSLPLHRPDCSHRPYSQPRRAGPGSECRLR